jgi:zinc transporter 1
VSGVVKVHELHVWSLIDDKLISSVHVLCLKEANFMKLASTMKDIFHRYQIHSSTIQPEYVSTKRLAEVRPPFPRAASSSSTDARRTRCSSAASAATPSARPRTRAVPKRSRYSPTRVCADCVDSLLTRADVTSILLRSGNKDELKQRKKHRHGRTKSKKHASDTEPDAPKSPSKERYDM